MHEHTRAFAQRLAAVVHGRAHQAVPEQHRKVVRPRVEHFARQKRIVRSRQRVMEDHAVGQRGELAQLVQRAEHIKIGRSPGVAAAARVAGFRHPHLAAGAVFVAQRDVGAAALAGHGHVFLGRGLAGLPVGRRHDRSQALRNAVVIVVAVHVQLFLGPGHQVVTAGNVAHQVGDAAAVRGLLLLAAGAHRVVVAGVAGADQDGLGVVLAHPGKEQVLVAGVIGRGVALRRAGQHQHVGLVHELGRVDGHAVLLAQRKDLFGLARVPRLVHTVQAGAVRDRDDELCIDGFDKVQHADPLFFG